MLSFTDLSEATVFNIVSQKDWIDKVIKEGGGKHTDCGEGKSDDKPFQVLPEMTLPTETTTLKVLITTDSEKSRPSSKTTVTVHGKSTSRTTVNGSKWEIISPTPSNQESKPYSTTVRTTTDGERSRTSPKSTVSIHEELESTSKATTESEKSETTSENHLHEETKPFTTTPRTTTDAVKSRTGSSPIPSIHEELSSTLRTTTNSDKWEVISQSSPPQEIKFSSTTAKTTTDVEKSKQTLKLQLLFMKNQHLP